MAHVQHYKAGDVKRLCNEYGREEELNNRDCRIATERTKDNYQLPSNRRMHYQLEYELGKRVSEVPHSNRKDLNVMSTWIVTLPEQLKTASDADKRRFFEVTYSFTQNRYGSENVMTGYVHMDETTPHIHVPTVPVDRNGRISSKNVFTRKELQGYQRELDATMEQEFGMKGLILNGRTKGSYTVRELKERTKQEQAIKRRETALDVRERDLQEREQSVIARQNALEAQEEVFQLEKDNYRQKYEKALKLANTAYEGYKEAYKNLPIQEKRNLIAEGRQPHGKLGVPLVNSAHNALRAETDVEKRKRLLANSPEFVQDFYKNEDERTFIS